MFGSHEACLGRPVKWRTQGRLNRHLPHTRKYSMMREFFAEAQTLSMMRLMSFICLIMACLITVFSLISKQDHSILTGVFLTYAFGGKLVQKTMEK